MSEANYSIRSVLRVCDILDLVQAHPDGLSLMALAEATELPKSSAFRYLTTLESRGYVERTPGGDYVRGPSLNGDSIDMLTRRLRPQLQLLRDRSGETVNLGFLDGTRITYLEVVESKASIRNAPRPADREYIHATALGKVLTANLPVDVVEAILQQEGMPARTPATITSAAEFLAELDRTRARGYAIDDEENELGGRCVAVPVPDTSLPVAVSISAPTNRLSLDAAAELATVMTAVLGAAAPFVEAGLTDPHDPKGAPV